MNNAFLIVQADWRRDRPALRQVREAVFVHEQKVPRDMEWDELDSGAMHVLAKDGQGEPIGTGRLTRDAHIGRMAVTREWRGRGVGTAMLFELMRIARQRGDTEIVLNAQVTAIPFYEKHGYSVTGERFMEAGILHQRMRKGLIDDG